MTKIEKYFMMDLGRYAYSPHELYLWIHHKKRYEKYFAKKMEEKERFIKDRESRCLKIYVDSNTIFEIDDPKRLISQSREMICQE